MSAVLSKYAIAYTNERVGTLRRSPTWEDVSIAYDAGLTHGVESPKRKVMLTYLRALRVVNAPLPDSEAGAS